MGFTIQVRMLHYVLQVAAEKVVASQLFCKQTKTACNAIKMAKLFNDIQEIFLWIVIRPEISKIGQNVTKSRYQLFNERGGVRFPQFFREYFLVENRGKPI